jgi:hypothetical protein
MRTTVNFSVLAKAFKQGDSSIPFVIHFNNGKTNFSKNNTFPRFDIRLKELGVML